MSLQPDSPDEALDLAELAAAARRICDGSVTEILPALRRAGGSPGGTRPKVLVGIRGDNLISGVDTLPAGHQPRLIMPASQIRETSGRLAQVAASAALPAPVRKPARPRKKP